MKIYRISQDEKPHIKREDLSDRTRYLLKDNNGNTVGKLTVQFHEGDDKFYLTSFKIDEILRSKGYGRMMMEEMLRDPRYQDKEIVVQPYSFDDSDPRYASEKLTEFYKHFGFQEHDKYPGWLVYKPKGTAIAFADNMKIYGRGKKILYIYRGLPGSGKSSLAGDSRGIVFSSDDFFMIDGEYRYDPKMLGDAHFWNLTRAIEAMKNGISPIIIDNTNTQAWEMKPYVENGLKYGYEIEIKEPNTPWKFDAEELAKRNVHGVPKEVIEKMIQKWEPNPTIEDILKAEKPKIEEVKQAKSLNWYKIASIEEIYEMVGEERHKILNEYYSKGRKRGSMMSWSVIPFARLKKIWTDYANIGVVRDINGMNEISQQMIKILCRLQASTDLSGHSQLDPDEIAKELGFKPVGNKNFDFYDSFLETAHGTPISDYGLDKLWKIAIELGDSSNPEDQLLLVDQMLNITHQRGDLAALFIEGGSSSLSQLSTNPNEIEEDPLEKTAQNLNVDKQDLFKSEIEKMGLKFIYPREVGALSWQGNIYPTISNQDGSVKVALDNTDIFIREYEVWVGDRSRPLREGYIIAAIVTLPEHRGKGLASQILKKINEAADKSGIMLKLEPTPMKSFIKKKEKGLSRKQLKNWYEKSGFKYTDETGLIMQRDPSVPNIEQQVEKPQTTSFTLKQYRLSNESKIRIDLSKYSKFVLEKIESYMDYDIDNQYRLSQYQFDPSSVIASMQAINYPNIIELQQAIESKDQEKLHNVQMQIFEWYKKNKDINLWSKISAVVHALNDYSDILAGNTVTWTKEFSENKYKELLDQTQKNMEKIYERVKGAISNLSSGWNDSLIKIEAIPIGGDSNLIAQDSARIDVLGGGGGAGEAGFTYFALDNGIEIDDVLEGGDEDFFTDNNVQTDYFNLINQLRNPSATNKKPKILTLYTARPVKDRNIYTNTSEIPSNIFLTNRYDFAEGFAREYGGQKDVWKVKILDKYVIKTMDAPDQKQYQVIGKGKVPIEYMEMIAPWEEKQARATNWYKLAKNYLDIGHGGRAKLWVWYNGKIYINQLNCGDDRTHPDAFRFLRGLKEMPYCGRYDELSKRVSVAIPPDKRGRSVPNILISRLYESFGNDIQIVEFGAS